MEWTDEAIVLDTLAHGEGGAVVGVLTPCRGRWRGLVRGGCSARRRGGLEPGSRVRATWRGRLAEQLGSLSCDLIATIAASILADAGRLAALQSACALLTFALPPHDPHPRCYDAFAQLLDALAAPGDWSAAYARWEMALLAELGYGLDLTGCAGGGDDRDLAFVSPRSGRAVSRIAGAPYRDKLLPLPGFLVTGGGAASAGEMRQALELTGYFLEKYVVADGARLTLPAARRRLLRRFAVAERG